MCMKKSIQTNILRVFVIFLFSSFFTGLYAQSHLLFGEWKAYLPYKKSLSLSESSNKVFCSNGISLFSIDKDDFSMEFLDKTNSLNDVGIIKHKYDPFNNQLLIVYRNGNIDILTDEDTYSMSELKNNSSLLGQKEINDIFIANKKYAYFAFDFGLTQINLEEFEFGFTCFTDFNINNVIQKGNTLYMTSDDGIYKFDLDSDKNPSDILHWVKITNLSCKDIVDFNDKTYFLANNTIFEISEDSKTDTIYSFYDNDYKSFFLKAFDNNLVLGCLNQEGARSKAIFIDKSGDIFEKDACAAIIKDILIDENNKVWYADNYNNVRYTDGIKGNCNEIFVDSPFSERNNDIETFGEKIFIASGGANKANFHYTDERAGFYIYQDGKWNNYSQYTNDIIRDNDIINLLTIAPSTKDNRVFIGSNWSGILELNLDDNSIKVHNKATTGNKVDGAQGDYQRERVIDMKFDSDNNLWATNFLALKPLIVYTKGNQWYNFSLKGKSQVGEIEIDQNDNIWIKIVNNGVTVYNTKGTINDPTDDEIASLTTSNSNLPSNNVNTIKTDLEGNVWVGTDLGPIVFECPGSVFEGKCAGSRKKTVLEGIPAYVLDNVNITAIEIDGANRKWFGSTSGVYVMSSSGEEELEHFTVKNSPLFDNEITDLAYNGETGEMIIGTLKGMLSYKTKTLEGTKRNDHGAFAYPNPVPPNYNGDIAVKGLARNANVKIVDINGHLVYETKALGGQAIWNGTDLHGNKVGSGVYTLFSTGSNNFDEPEAIAVKIFFIK